MTLDLACFPPIQSSLFYKLIPSDETCYNKYMRSAIMMKTFCIKRAIDVFNEEPYVNTAFLCGSYANDTASERSDIDFAILPGRPLSLLDEMKLQARLSEVLHFENIDVVNLLRAPVMLQFNLISKSRLIYERNRDKTDSYMERMLKTYHDREYRYRAFEADFKQGLKEDYC